LAKNRADLNQLGSDVGTLENRRREAMGAV